MGPVKGGFLSKGLFCSFLRPSKGCVFLMFFGLFWVLPGYL